MKAKSSLLDPQLEVFLAVAKNKSMHGAGKEIYLSQTAITQRIKSLEKRLRATLFIRTRHGVQLTADGEVLLRYCHATQELEGETLARMRSAGSEFTARVCITGPSSAMASRIIPQCLPLLNKFPKLLVTFNVNDSEQRIKLLQDGTHHFAIIEPQYILKEMQHQKLRDEKYILVCTPKWKKRELTDILATERIIDFDEGDPATFNYLIKYNLLDHAQKERHFLNRTDSLLNMFMQGYGYGVLTRSVAKPYLDKQKLIELNSGKECINKLVLVWYARPEPSKYFSEIIRAIK